MRIRVARPTDAAAMAAIYAPIATGTAISFEETAPSPDLFAARIANVARTHPWLVAELGGEVAGYAYAFKHRERSAYRWAADVSVYVAERWRKQGVGRALYGALFEELRRLGYLR